MVGFILLTVYILFILSEKLFFLLSESSFKASAIGKVDFAMLFLIFIVGALSFLGTRIRKIKPRVKVIKKALSFKTLALIGGIIITIGLSFYLNSHKRVQEWDSVALYDARAKFLKSGISFSEMTQFSKYDEISYYYLMYPPFTSIAHYFWDVSGTRLPVSLFYSFYLLFFAVTIFFLTRELLGDKLSLILTFLTVTSKDIFVLSILEYTNLPFTTNIVLGVILLLSYLKRPVWWKFLYAIFLIATSQWIRYLEPVWLLSLLVFGVVSYDRKTWKRWFLINLIFLGVGLLEYVSWGYFTKIVARSPSSVSFSLNDIGIAIKGIISIRPIEAVIELFNSFGILSLGYALLVVSGILFYKALTQKKELLHLWLFEFLCIPFYFSAIYFSSFKGDWWNTLSGSIGRSASFMIPVGLMYLLMIIKNVPILRNKR